jgi:hypothetical protein
MPTLVPVDTYITEASALDPHKSSRGQSMDLANLVPRTLTTLETAVMKKNEGFGLPDLCFRIIFSSVPSYVTR